MKKKVTAAVVVLVGVVMLLGALLLSYDTRVADEKLQESFKEYEDVTIDDIKISENQNVRYVRRGKSQNPLLVMVHGAPGDLTAFSGYLRDSLLAEKFDLLAYDRPGYNGEDKEPRASIVSQANALFNLISQVSLDSQSIVLMSHSYGGPIAALAAIDLGDRVNGHLMLSPVIDPHSEPMFWYSKFPVKAPFKWIAAQPNKTASYEKIEHRKHLKSLIDKWANMPTNTLMIHGEKDWLAPIENAKFVKETFPESLTEIELLEDASHFFIWSNKRSDFIKNKLLSLSD